MKINFSKIAVLATAGLTLASSDAIAGGRFFAGVHAGILNSSYDAASYKATPTNGTAALATDRTELNKTVESIRGKNHVLLASEQPVATLGGAGIGYIFDQGKAQFGIQGSFNFDFNSESTARGVEFASRIDGTTAATPSKGTQQFKNNWSFDVLARLGVSLNGGSMYLLGGVNYQKFTVTTAKYTTAALNGETTEGAFSIAVGAGAEAMVTDNAYVFLEYTYNIGLKKDLVTTDKVTYVDFKVPSGIAKVGFRYFFEF